MALGNSETRRERRASLDTQCAAVLRQVAQWGAPEIPSVAEWRALERRRFEEFAAAPEPVGNVRDMTVPGAGGAIPVRVYSPNRAALGTFVWLHGGGWVLGSPELCDDQARLLTNASGCVVISVDYRLAPEHPFPQGLEDCLTVVRWAAAGAGTSGNSSLIVGGDSAGGNLVAAVTLLARDCGEPEIDMQVLVHPALDRNADTASMREFARGYGLSASAMRALWDHYAPATDDPLVSPLRAPRLHGLPPALIVTAECDILRDESEEYAERLRAAGVPVILLRYDGMMHGFLAHAAAIDAARTAFSDVGAAVRAWTSDGRR
jgi:acetyl esterase